MMKRNIWVLTLLITLCSQLYGQAYRGYGGYMLGLWSIEWSKLNNQITDLNVDNFGISISTFFCLCDTLMLVKIFS